MNSTDGFVPELDSDDDFLAPPVVGLLPASPSCRPGNDVALGSLKTTGLDVECRGACDGLLDHRTENENNSE